MVPVAVERIVRGYLNSFDRVLPSRLEAFYLVGSIALGAFRPSRSDIDFVAVISGACNGKELQSLRALNLLASVLSARWTLGLGGRCWPAGLNGVFVTWQDLALSPNAKTPIASQKAGRFSIGKGFDVNPVTWHVLARCGVAVRGPDPIAINIHTDERELLEWVAGNLSSYWATWANQLRSRTSVAIKALLPRGIAWGVLGAPRLHATLKTAEILSKEEAGDYALISFPGWHPLIMDALAYWRGDRSYRWNVSPFLRRRAAADFVAEVVADGENLRAPNG